MSLYPYHRQDRPEWCGAAGIQMILEKHGQLAGNKAQRPIFDNVNELPDWNASPRKIPLTLNRSLGSGDYELYGHPQDLAGAATPAEAEDVLAAVKASAAHGVMLPIRQYDHWVVVTEAFVGDSKFSAKDQLHLCVNDPLRPTIREAFHEDHGPHGVSQCLAGQCGPSPEIWGPVKISDFLVQLRWGTFCVKRPGKHSPITGEIKTARDGAGDASLKDSAEVLAAALDHYEFLRGKFSQELPLLAKDAVHTPGDPSSNMVRSAGPSSSGYQQRWQVRLVSKETAPAKAFSVWVELCARTLRLSRVRYIDNKPDWWAGGSVWR